MGGIRPSGMHINKPVVIGILVVMVVFIFIYKLWWSTGSVSTFTAFNFGSSNAERAAVDSDRSDQSAALILDPAVEAKLPVVAKTIEVTIGGNKLQIYCQQVVPADGASPKLDILLLHGAAFSSANWTQIKTPQLLASWGYRAMAIDSPGHGKTPGTIPREDMAKLLEVFVPAASLSSNLVVVAPSASGAIALPYLFEDPKLSTKRAVGFVPVTPVLTDTYGTKFPESQLPTLIVYGTNDPNGGSVARNLQLLPKFTLAPIQDAGHPCYLDKPRDFHTVLYTWLKSLATSS